MFQLLQLDESDSATFERHTSCHRFLVAAALIVGLHFPVYAQHDHPLAAAGGEHLSLAHRELGSGSLSIQSSASSQTLMNQGLRLIHAYEAGEALKAFAEAQRLDPQCAMCFWGEAMALGPTVNYEMNEGSTEQAGQALRHAIALGARETHLNQALIAALSIRYGPADMRKANYLAYAKAMDIIAAQHASDDELLVLAADAWMMTDRKWWAADGATPFLAASKAMSLLQQVLHRNPRQTAAIHLLIHLTEKSSHLNGVLPFVQQLERNAPDASHMIHMASHVYFRLGKYEDAKKANLRAVETDRRLAKQPGRADLKESPTFRHNVYFGMTSALISGDQAAASHLASLLLKEAPLDHTTPQWTYPIYGLAFIALSAKPTRIAFARPKPDSPFLSAMWVYARGVRSIRLGKLAAAHRDLIELSDLTAAQPVAGSPQLSITMKIAKLDLSGRIAIRQNRNRDAVSNFLEAATLQESASALDPPLWWYPVSRNAALTMLADGKYKAAELEARRALVLFKNDPISLLALARAQRASGRTKDAVQIERNATLGWYGGNDILHRSLVF